MKKVVFVLIAFLFTTGVALATPIYNGETYADYGVGNNPALPTATGYYIWSNNIERTSWSVRWTGNNNGTSYDWVDWFGSIEFGGLNLESYDAVLFEANHSDALSVYSDIPNFGDLISFQGYAGNHWDGFDFTISGDVGNVIGFNLGSTLWDFTASTTAYEGIGIYIGQDGSAPNVIYQTFNGTNYVGQNFEVPAPVPEPATMILLGVGLAGLAGVSRKKILQKK